MSTGTSPRIDSLSVAPLVGFPGVHLTGATIKESLYDGTVQSRVLQAISEHFRPDMLFTFMDLSVEADALGMLVRYGEMESPSVTDHLIKTREDLPKLDKLATSAFAGRGRIPAFTETVRETKRALPGVPLSAYITGPFTLAGLLMGASDIAMNTILDSDLVDALMERSYSAARQYAAALWEAGADVITVLDPTAMMLSPEQYWQFAGSYMERLTQELPGRYILHICGNTSHLIEHMSRTGAMGLSLDYQVDLRDVATRVPETLWIIGNVNPVETMAQKGPGDVRQTVLELRRSMQGVPNFLLSTGCDLPPETPHANIEAFMEAARAKL
jgi:uroporphyrinogen decarboxylase